MEDIYFTATATGPSREAALQRASEQIHAKREAEMNARGPDFVCENLTPYKGVTITLTESYRIMSETEADRIPQSGISAEAK